MKKITIFLILVISLSSISFTALDEFTDLEDEWSIEYIEWGVENSLIQGYLNESGESVLNPRGNITEGEFAAILFRYITNGDYSFEGEYENWQEPYYEKLEEYQIPLSGNYNKVLLRKDIAEIITATFGFNMDSERAVYLLYENSISEGTGQNLDYEGFNPYGKIQRQELMAFLNRVDYVLNKQGGLYYKGEFFHIERPVGFKNGEINYNNKEIIWPFNEQEQNEQVVKNYYGIYNVHMGMKENDLLSTLGEPSYKLLSAYEYTWWVYEEDIDNFLMVGMEDGNVVNIYSNSKNWKFDELQFGSDLDELNKRFELIDVVFEYKDANIIIKKEDAFNGERYLYKLDNDVFVEFYIDIHENNTLRSIRFSNSKDILNRAGYSITYSWIGDKPRLILDSLNEDVQEKVDIGNSKIMHLLIDSSRNSFGLNRLIWHQETADLALSHSIDMKENNFFDHHSPTTGSIKDRFDSNGINYSMIAENIAFGQGDSIDAHEGLMNSLGHRKNILRNDNTHLGTGTYNKFYTIKFINPR